MTRRLLMLKLLSVAASLLLHAAACASIMLAPGWRVVRESILIAELVSDPEPAAAAVKPVPDKPDPRPLKLPRPIRTPMPKRVEPPAETPAVTPPPAAAVAPAPAAPVAGPPSIAETASEFTSTTEPVASAGRGPLAPAEAPLASPDGEGLATQSGPPTPPERPAAPTVAALPYDGITQTAAPRGGYQVKPSYPTSARRAGIQGTTLLGVFVGADGHVGDVVVKQSAGHPDLDAAAADAVRRWRFEPARRGSEPVAMWVLLPVQFRLR